VNLGKSKYNDAAARHNWPSYYMVKNARQRVLYPSNISYGENRVEVPLSELISHSCARILEFFFEENSPVVLNLTESDQMSLELWGKVGGDGQGDHSQYSQKNDANVSGTSIYCSSYVPLQLKANGKLIWVNSEPNSPLICQPLVFTFAKETDELIQVEESNLRKQIENLPDLFFTVGTENFCLKAGSVHISSTMWDGKSCTSIAKTFLSAGKKLASNTCHLCLANPGDMNSPEVWKRPIQIPEMIHYSCTPLHMWIRSMEFLFHLAMKLPEGNSSKPLTSQDCQLTKLELKAKFWRQLNIRLFVVKPGQGSSNNGNTARIFFKKDPNLTAAILKIDPKVISLFASLLDMFNDPNQKPCSNMFDRLAKELFGILTSPPLNVFPMSQSVHRFLCHGKHFIENFELPIGALSESALEARNKYNRKAREFHARKTSMKDNVQDVFHHLLCTSDPYLYLKRNKK
jgi:hypothetical protein